MLWEEPRKVGTALPFSVSLPSWHRFEAPKHNGVKPIMKLYFNFQLNLNFDSKWALLRYDMVFSSILYPIIYIPKCLTYIGCAFSSLITSCLNQISCYFLLSVRLQAQFALKTDEKSIHQQCTVLLLFFKIFFHQSLLDPKW